MSHLVRSRQFSTNKHGSCFCPLQCSSILAPRLPDLSTAKTSVGRVSTAHPFCLRRPPALSSHRPGLPILIQKYEFTCKRFHIMVGPAGGSVQSSHQFHPAWSASPPVEPARPARRSSPPAQPAEEPPVQPHQSERVSRPETSMAHEVTFCGKLAIIPLPQKQL